MNRWIVELEGGFVHRDRERGASELAAGVGSPAAHDRLANGEGRSGAGQAVGLAHAILSAWWGIEDNTGWDYALAFAEMIAELKIK